MSTIEQCGITLQHDIDEQYQYQPGEIVRGRVTLLLSKKTQITNINLKVHGSGNVRWNDESGNVIEANELYLDSVKDIVDTTGHDALLLNQGHHEFPFDYVLPENIPTSYIGKYGNVTYIMKVTVTGLQSKNTAISSEPFLVLNKVPLPTGFEAPITMACEKRVWASCSFGKLIMNIKLDRGGGVPGEDVFLQAEIKNCTKRTVTAMQGALIMTSVFRAQKRTMEFRQIVSKKRDEFDVTQNEGRRWNFVRLSLPSYIPESKLDHCDIIEIDYIFQFRVEMTGGSEFRIESPFLIGALPKALEIPEDKRTAKKINRGWTVRAKGMLGIDEPAVDYDDDDDDWQMGVVPELRPDSVTVNPLFMSNSFMEHGVQVMPDNYVISNTKIKNVFDDDYDENGVNDEQDNDDYNNDEKYNSDGGYANHIYNTDLRLENTRL